MVAPRRVWHRCHEKQRQGRTFEVTGETVSVWFVLVRGQMETWVQCSLPKSEYVLKRRRRAVIAPMAAKEQH